MFRKGVVLSSALCLWSVFLAAGDLVVMTMPAPGCGRPTYAWVGRELPVWGSVTGGIAPYDYVWDFGDGTQPARGDVADARHILAPHTYSVAGTYIARLMVTDGSVPAQVESATVPITVAPQADLDVKVSAAIQDGLRFLYLNQQTDGAWEAGPYGGHAYAAGAGIGALAFEEQGYRAQDGGIYAQTVRRALEYVVASARALTINDGKSDTHNGNGQGFGFHMINTPGDIQRAAYETGIAMMAVVLSGDPDAVIAAGALQGKTYRYAVEEAVDWCAFVQTTAADGLGGWRYYKNYGKSDNSCTQWPAIGLEAAETLWGIQAPAFVKTQLIKWLRYSQNASGGFGYDTPNAPNVARTAGGWCALAYADVPTEDSRIQRVLDYLQGQWSGTMAGEWTIMYQMYGVTKAARISQPKVTKIRGLDWQTTFNDYLVRMPSPQNYSLAQGSWWSYNSAHIDGRFFGTSLAILVLSPRTINPVVANAGADQEVAPGTPVCFDGSGSYHSGCGQGSIVSYAWDIGCDGTYELEGATPCLWEGLEDTGADHDVCVRLRVVDDATPPWEDLDDMIVHVTNRPGLRLNVSQPLERTCRAGVPIAWVATVTAEGSPVESAQVPVRNQLTGEQEDLTTDGEGRVQISVPTECTEAPGVYQMTIGPCSKAGFANSSIAIRRIVIGAELALTVMGGQELIERQGSVEYRIQVKSRGQPVPEAEIFIDDGLTPAIGLYVTDANGEYTYRATAPASAESGRYAITLGPATKLGYRGSSVVTKEVWITGPLTLGIDIAGTRVAGQGDTLSWGFLVSCGDDAVPGATLAIVDPFAPVAPATVLTTDLAGGASYTTFVPSDWAAGSYELKFGPAHRDRFTDSDQLTIGVTVQGTLLLDILSAPAQVALPGIECSLVVRARVNAVPVEGVDIPVHDALSAQSTKVTTGLGGLATYTLRVPDAPAAGSYEVAFGPAGKEGYSAGNTVAGLLIIRGAQNADVQGRIYDLATGEGLGGATVTLAGSTTETEAGTGNFSFQGVAPGSYELGTAKSGYVSSQRSVTVSAPLTRASLGVKPNGVVVAPEVVTITSKFSSPEQPCIFLDGVDLNVEFTVVPEWKSNTPGKFVFITPTRTVSQDGATCTFNVGADFGPGGRLKVALVAPDGIRRSAAVDAGIEVAPAPWVALPLVYQWQVLEGQHDVSYGMPELSGGSTIIDMTEKRVPDEIPYFRDDVGIDFDTLLKLAVTVTNDGMAAYTLSSRFGEGQPRDERGRFKKKLKLFGMELETGIGFSFSSYYDTADNAWKPAGGSFVGDLYAVKGWGPRYLFPLPLCPVPVPGYARGELEVDLGIEIPVLDLSDEGPELNGRLSFTPSLTGAVGAGIYQAACIEGSLTIANLFEFQWPADEVFRKWVLTIDGNVAVTVLVFKWEGTPWHMVDWCIAGPDCQGPGGRGRALPRLSARDFTLMGRDYLDRRGRGEAPGKGKGPRRDGMDVVRIEEGCFPHAEPQVVPLGDQGALLVWVRDDGMRESQNRTAIAYSRGDGQAWSAAATIDEDGTADFAPQLAVHTKGAICVWQSLSETLPADATLAAALPLSEIKAAFFDRAEGRWLPAEQITADEYYDRSPCLASYGTGALLAWVKNRSNDLFGNRTTAPNALYAASWSAQGWSSPRAIAEGLGTITKTALAYKGGEACYVFVMDQDDDPSTIDDQELYVLTNAGGQWSGLRRLTDDTTQDTNPQVTYLDGGEPLLVWYREGRIVCCRDFLMHTARVAAEGPEAQGAFDFALRKAFPGGTMLLWSDRGPSGVDVFANYFWEATDAWGAPLRLTDDVDSERYVSGCTMADGSLVATFVSSEVRRELRQADMGGQTVVYHEEVVGASDLAVVHLQALPDLAVAGDTIAVTFNGAGEAEVSAVVRNLGTIPVENASVEFASEASAQERERIGELKVISGLLLPGAEAVVSAAWASPRDDCRVCVTTDPEKVCTERDEENNAACRPAFLPNLAIVSAAAEWRSATSATIHATIANLGRGTAEPAGAEFRLLNDAVPFARQDVPALDVGATLDLDADLEVAADLAGEVQLVEMKVIPATGSAEIDEANNSRTLRLMREEQMRRGYVFKRGDVNGSGMLDMADAISILSYLFAHDSLKCQLAADVNTSGVAGIDIADAIYLLAYLFVHGAPPPAPFPECGPVLMPYDPWTAALGCENSGCK